MHSKGRKLEKKQNTIDYYQDKTGLLQLDTVMDPKNRMERAIALRAIANTAEQMEEAGADGLQVTNFITGAREKLAQERPDMDARAKAAASAAKWAKTNYLG